MDFISCLMLRDLHPLIPQRGLTITQTQRPVEKWGPPMGIEPTSPGLNPGVLSQLNYGVIRWTSGVIERRHSMPGIEPGPPRLSPRTVHPPLFRWITDQLRPIRNCPNLKKRQIRRKSLPTCFRSSTAERRSLKSWLWVQLPSEAPEFDELQNSAIVLAMT